MIYGAREHEQCLFRIQWTRHCCRARGRLNVSVQRNTMIQWHNYIEKKTHNDIKQAFSSLMSWRSSLVQCHHLPNWPQWRWVGGPMLVWSNIISYLFWYSGQFFERQYHAFGSQMMQVLHWPISDWFLLSSLLSSSHIGDGVDGVPPKVNQVSSWEEGLAQPMIYHQYYFLLKIWTFM